MKKRALIWTMMISLFFLLPGAGMAEKKPHTVKVGKGGTFVSYVEGAARTLSKGQREWRALKLNDVLHDGDEVNIGIKARLELALPDQSRLRFAEKSRFRIVQAPETGSGNVRVHLTMGRTWANVSKTLGIKRKFEISCDNAVAGVRGTVYRMNVHEDKSALVRVYDGEVAVSGASQPMDRGEQVFGKTPTRVAGPKPVPGPHKISMEEWTVLLRSMQQISIRSDGTADKPREFTVQEDRDDWVDWNKERDGEGR